MILLSSDRHADGRLVRVGTRASPLALWQTERVIEALRAHDPVFLSETVKINTSGDRYQKGSLADIGGKGLFAKEIDSALFDGAVDLAVHSLKDLETTPPKGLVLAAVLSRGDSRDALIGGRLDALPNRARVGTCSVRRAAQIRMLRPDLDIVPMRGNVQTRLAKLESGAAEAILLSYVGLQRLGLSDLVAEVLEPQTMIPAVGQGVIAVMARCDDVAMLERLAAINHRETAWVIAAERAMLAELDGTCHTPIGGHAVWQGELLKLSGIVLSADGQCHVHHVVESNPATLVEAEALGHEVGMRLKERGQDILASLMR